MGKIMVVGKAEKEFPADQCDLFLEINVSRKTAVEASRVSTKQCEELLGKLKDLGIEPSAVEISHDSIDKRSSYNSDEISYESKKALCIHIAADMRLINAIRDIIETGFEDVSFGTRFSVSNEATLRKDLLKSAIVDSRAKATLLADSMGLEITGIESANLSGDDDVYDVAEEEHLVRYKACYGAGDVHCLTDLLTPDKVELDAEVKIVWLLSDDVAKDNII